MQHSHSISCIHGPVRPWQSAQLWRGAGPAGSKQQGVSLIEALVALLIVAFGVLGMLGLQLGILSDTRSSVQRAQAIRIMEDLSERVKSNPSRFSVLDAYVLSSWTAADTAQARDCSAAVCTAEQQAAWDIEAWQRNVALTLPGAQAITFLSQDEASNTANRRQLGVLLAWRQNDRAVQARDTAFSLPFAVSEESGGGAMACPNNMMCHLAYIQP